MSKWEGVDDLVVVNAVLTGETEAFAILVNRYQTGILSFARYYLRHPEDAEDATQEAFFKVFRSLKSFDLSRSFKPWLYRVATNSIRSYGSKRLRVRRDDEVASQLPPPEYPSPDSDFTDKEQIEMIRARIRELPTKPREAAVLYYLQGFSVTETAESLGVSDENAKSRLHRARKHLRKTLSDNATDEEKTE